MALRLVEVHLPEGTVDMKELEKEHAVVDWWKVEQGDGGQLLHVLLNIGETEGFLERVDALIGNAPHYRVVLLPVQATLPRPEEQKEQTSAQPAEEEGKKESPDRISREELYQDVTESIGASRVYHTFVVLSTLVAASGLLRDNVAVVIGAMVIAPLLGPNMALALGTTLGDTELLRRAVRVNATGLLLAMALAVGMGSLFDPSLEMAEIASRTHVSLADVALALAAGVAGTLSFTRGFSGALIGVMVAVALLPPLVAFGLLVGAGEFEAAYGALLLLFTNVVSVNLAAVVTFLAQGIRPMKWYEAEQARKATRIAIVLWIFLLVLLVIAILLAPSDL